MLEPDLILLFTQPLERLGLPYMVTGSVAGILYGEPRLTHDVDIVVEIPRHLARAVSAAFPESEFYCPPEEVIAVEAARPRRGHFNLIHHGSGFKADLYLVGEDPLHRWALQRVHRLPLGGAEIVAAPPEYVILRKLEYYREGGSDKHVRDIRSILALQGASLDRVALERWAESAGLTALWKRIETGSD